MYFLLQFTDALMDVSKRKDTENEVWRFCNAACVRANLVERKCDLTMWFDTWKDCRLSTWKSQAEAEKVDKRLDDPGGLIKIMILETP